MAEPVFDDVAAVHRVDDVIEVLGRTPGPAGSANLLLPGGAQLRVDYAEPQVLVDWSHEAAAVPGDATLAPLFGEQVTAQIVAYLDSGARTPRRIEGTATSLRPPGGPPTATPARRVGELVRLVDRVDDDRSLLERAAAALDVAAGRFADEWGPVVAPILAAHRDLSAELVDDCTDEFVLRALSDTTVRDLLLTPPYRELLPAALLDWLERDGAHRYELELGVAETRATLAAPMVSGARRSVRRMVRGDVAEPTMPAPVVDRHGGVWTVRVPRGARSSVPTWIRVLGDDRAVLAAAPCTDDGDDCTAELLVPPALGVDDVQVIVTHDPFPVTGANALAGIARAVRAGRTAVDLETAGNARRAHQSWIECARRWEGLGDTERRDAAARCADTASLRTRDARSVRSPGLVDLLTAERH